MKYENVCNASVDDNILAVFFCVNLILIYVNLDLLGYLAFD